MVHEIRFLAKYPDDLCEIHDEKFNGEEQIIAFRRKNGEILACGTCLK